MCTQRLQGVPKDFNFWVRKGIDLLGSWGKEMDNKSAIAFLAGHDIPEEEAVEITLFLPIAFCRKMLPQINFPSEYIELKNQLQIEMLFSENERYLAIEHEVNAYWNNNPMKEVILNVAGRSPEFRAINDLLLGGGHLEDIQLTKVVITY